MSSWPSSVCYSSPAAGITDLHREGWLGTRESGTCLHEPCQVGVFLYYCISPSVSLAILSLPPSLSPSLPLSLSPSLPLSLSPRFGCDMYLEWSVAPTATQEPNLLPSCVPGGSAVGHHRVSPPRHLPALWEFDHRLAWKGQ